MKTFSLFSLSILLLFLSSCNDTASGNKNNLYESVDSLDYQTISQEPLKKTAIVKPLAKTLKANLNWTAFKTKNKVAVNGSFKNIDLQNIKNKPSFEESLLGASFSIDTKQVTTGDPSRDSNLVSFFFKRLPSTTISGSLNKFENNKVTISIILNDNTANKIFDYVVDENKIIITGSIDLINDFQAIKAFKSLEQACFDLHEGKTWSDVDFKVIIAQS